MGRGGGGRGGGGGVLVKQTCWRVSLRCPFAVSVYFGRCLHTSLDVRPGQVVKKPASVALYQVLTMGLKQAQCRKCTSAGGVFIW